jgi:hypothetical protein
VTAPDFEITARLSARKLVSRIPPDPQTAGEDVTLAHDERRRGSPGKMETGRAYDDVVIEKRIVGEIEPGAREAARD